MVFIQKYNKEYHIVLHLPQYTIVIRFDEVLNFRYDLVQTVFSEARPSKMKKRNFKYCFIDSCKLVITLISLLVIIINK